MTAIMEVVEGGGRMFGGAELTNSKGVAKDIWTIGFGSCQRNSLAVRAVDGTTGVGTTYFTQTVATPGKVSFYSDRDEEKGHFEIYVMNVDGSNQVNLTNTPEYDDGNPDWSPDDNWIAFVSERDGNLEIWVTDGPHQTRLTYGTRDLNPAWSPDGSKIVFNGNRDYPGTDNLDTYVMNADGSDRVNLTSFPALNARPAWSRCVPH